MAANVLKRRRAAQVSVEVVRAFVQVRRFALANRELARKLCELEQRHDGRFHHVFDALRARLTSPEPDHRRKIGCKRND
jgi:hypothetical protein